MQAWPHDSCKTHEYDSILSLALTLSDSFSRLTNYSKRHGFRATISRAALFLRRLFVARRMVLFYYDLQTTDAGGFTENWPRDLVVERKTSQAEISPEDQRKIVEFWNPEIARRDLAERFAANADLWLIRFEDKLAGYGWTLAGRTLKPHYLPLGKTDLHLFDFLVFPEYRGRGINPALVRHILEQGRAEGLARAYIEATEWNEPQLTSLTKTGFHRLGIARKMSLFGRTVVDWGKGQGGQTPAD